jgi:hypothetical protein
VAYTAPVFWFFLLLIAISVFVFRQREPDWPLPYRMPLYPLPPILFGGACAWMICSRDRTPPAGIFRSDPTRAEGRGLGLGRGEGSAADRVTPARCGAAGAHGPATRERLR